jgi:hypothetical protein
MVSLSATRRPLARSAVRLLLAPLALGLSAAAAAAQSGGPSASAAPPSPDPRIGLRAGLHDAGEAVWNMRVVSKTPSPAKFSENANTDLAFTGRYVLQGNYNGFQVWDLADPAKPALVKDYFCPASQSDVSVYKNLLFVSGEGNEGRLDCGAGGVRDTVSADRLRGIRIFDISDVRDPKYIANVQTCRGSHTHTVLADPRDTANVYVYVSGSANVRSPNELPGCVRQAPGPEPELGALPHRGHPGPARQPEGGGDRHLAAHLRRPHGAARHGEAPEDVAVRTRMVADAKARGAFTAVIDGVERVVRPAVAAPLLDSVVKARGGTGQATAADSAALRGALSGILQQRLGAAPGRGPRPGPTQCHDITVYPAIGLAGGACEGYGLLLDIRDPANPTRVAAAADSNFSYWHSATFNNDGTKVLFTDEWGGGGAPKCRATDPKQWGANAIFTVQNREMQFQSYYKLPAAQTPQENCVAHNGSLIPIPGRDVMIQAWYQGGLSVFDWTDPKNVREIAFFDRGPVDSTRMQMGGSWSVYWYNGTSSARRSPAASTCSTSCRARTCRRTRSTRPRRCGSSTSTRRGSRSSRGRRRSPSPAPTSTSSSGRRG